MHWTSNGCKTEVTSMFHFFSARPAFFRLEIIIVNIISYATKLLFRAFCGANFFRHRAKSSEWEKKYKQLTVGEAIIGCANHGASDRRHNAHRLSALVLHLTIHRWLLSCDYDTRGKATTCSMPATYRLRSQSRSLDASYDDLGIFRFW